MTQKDKYWFPAKKFGWGWGPPATWQGWTVIAVFALLAVAGIFIFPPGRETLALVAYFVVLNVCLTGICWLKGEPPRWRWGRTDE